VVCLTVTKLKEKEQNLFLVAHAKHNTFQTQAQIAHISHAKRRAPITKQTSQAQPRCKSSNTMNATKRDYWKGGSNWIALYVFLACIPMVVIAIFIVSNIRYRRQLKREADAARRGTAWTYPRMSRPTLGVMPKPEKSKKVTLLHRRGRNLLRIYTEDLEMEQGMRAERGTTADPKTPAKTPAKKSPLKMA
jgi:hypothetical protein